MSLLCPLLAWTEALRNAGLDLYNDHLRTMFEAPFLALQPDGCLPAFHDNGGPLLANHATRYEIGFARYGDPMFAWPLRHSRRQDLNALLYGVAHLPETTPTPKKSVHFPTAGFVYLRQGYESRRPSYLALEYGPHGGGHGHPDKLSFILCSGKNVLAPDPGSVAYGVPMHHKWFKQTISHNTMLVDGESQARCTGRLHFLIDGADFSLLSADADEAYPGIRMSRTLLFMKDFVLMLNGLSSDTPHTFDWVYHNRGSLRTSFPRKPLQTKDKNGRLVSPSKEKLFLWKHPAGAPFESS